MKTALVIGGSGMLAGLTQRLADSYDIVGVVGRDPHRLQDLAERSDKIIPIQADYTSLKVFLETLESFVTTHGKPELTVSWIHSTAPRALIELSQYCSGDIYDVLSSSSREPDHPSRVHQQPIEAQGLSYHCVILGHVGDRWLTNEEISNGVYEAIQAQRTEYIVGE